MSVSKTEIIRPLGPLENFVSVHHLLKTALRTIVTGRYSIPEKTTPETLESTIKLAVALTVLDHPLLQPGLLDEDSKQPSWVRLPSLNLDQMINFVDVPKEKLGEEDEGLRQHLVKCHNTPFTNLETIPGWSVTVLRRDADNETVDIIFHYSHTNIDGMSGKIFHKTLRQKLNHIAASSSSLSDLSSSISLSSNPSILPLPSSSILPPTQESLMTFPISPSFIFSSGWKGLRPQLLVPRHFAHWAPISHIPGQPNQTSLRLLTIPSPKMKSLLASCRKASTTLTGLLHSLVLVSLTRQLTLKDGTQEGGFVGGTTFDMRRFAEGEKMRRELGMGDDEVAKVGEMMGNYVTLFGHTFDAGLVGRVKEGLLASQEKSSSDGLLKSLVWEVAAKVRGELKDKLDMGTRDDLMGLVPYIAKGDLRGVLKGEMTKARECSWEVSNVGALDSDDADEEEWEIERLVCSQSAVANGAAVLVFPISVKGGELCVTVSAQKGVVEEGILDGLEGDLRFWLGSLGEQQ